MNITLENAMVYIGIITFAMTLAKMLVITPLKDAISRLEIAIEKLGAQLARIDERVDKQSERIASGRARRKIRTPPNRRHC